MKRAKSAGKTHCQACLSLSNDGKRLDKRKIRVFRREELKSVYIDIVSRRETSPETELSILLPSIDIERRWRD